MAQQQTDIQTVKNHVIREWTMDEISNVQLAPMDEFLVIVNGVLMDTFKGPSTVIKKDIETTINKKNVKDTRLLEVRYSELKETMKKKRYDTPIFDYVYNVKLECALYVSVSVESLNMVQLLETNKYNDLIAWTYDDLIKNYEGSILHFVTKNLFKIIAQHEVSILEFNEIFNSFNTTINELLNNELLEEGIAFKVFMNRIDVLDNQAYKELKAIISKAKEMEVLGYTYRDEHYLNFIKLVESNKEGGE